MRKLSLALVIAAIVAVSAVTLNPPAPVAASPAEDYSPAAPYFGAGNLPPGCEFDESVASQMKRRVANKNNVCYHMRTDMNGLDSPQVDVLVMVPVSPTAERDMRIMRQSIEMWEGGINYLATEMGLDWLATGMDFHITVEAFDPAGDGGGEFTTYPIVDPEIVVVASNPAGGLGIGVDPVDFATNFGFTNEDLVPCLNVANPFDFSYWENLPGFNSHHEARTGTYNEDCGGKGGNICFAVNGAIDPAPGAIDFFGLFDLVSHEVGHCMTVGHVGDGAEGKWGALPSNDIMAYSQDPPGLTKCVSTLDVEGVALRMSKYLDVNGDAAIDDKDLLQANDQVGEGRNDFQIQHPGDHLSASSTGSPLDCPQPDLGAVAGSRTDWTPTPVRTTQPLISITSPADGAINDTGVFNVAGTVEHQAITPAAPTEPTGTFDDADDDATTPLTEILDLNVAATQDHVNATIRLADVPPVAVPVSSTTYSIEIDGRRFDSFVFGTGSGQPRTWDSKGGATGTGGYMAVGTSTWDAVANTVTFKIPRAILAAGAIVSPYYVGSTANLGVLTAVVVDDRAPEATGTVGVAHSSGLQLPQLSLADAANTVTFKHPQGNTFYAEDTTFGVNRGTRHTFPLDVVETSDVEFKMAWNEGVAGADLDLYVTGTPNENPGATFNNPETFVLKDVKGALTLAVDPYFVTDPLSGSTYTLTATVTPKVVTNADADADGIFDSVDACPTQPGTAPTGCPDTDGDGVIDSADLCPTEAGEGADGCPIQPTEFVHLWVGGAIAATQAVDTANGPDTFNLPVALAEGTYELRVDWETARGVIASRTITLTHNTDDDGDGVVNSADRCPGFDDFDDLDNDGVPDGCDTDTDADGHADHRDNCKNVFNPDQANIDGDARGDVCDSDKDGDGHSNDKELDHGTDPADPNSYPGKPKTGGVAI